MKVQELIEDFTPGEIRTVWTGSQAEYADSIFSCYYHKDDEGDLWVDSPLENSTVLEFIKYTTINETPGLKEYYDEYKMSWIKDGNIVAAKVISCPGWFDDLSKDIFYFDRQTFEKKTLNQKQWREVQRSWIHSLKEAKKPKYPPLNPGTTYVIWDHDAPEVMDGMYFLKKPVRPRHGDQYDSDSDVFVPNGDQITYKHKWVNDDGTWYAIEYQGMTLYGNWMFPQHIILPEDYRALQIKWMNSLKGKK